MLCPALPERQKRPLEAGATYTDSWHMLSFVVGRPGGLVESSRACLPPTKLCSQRLVLAAFQGTVESRANRRGEPKPDAFSRGASLRRQRHRARSGRPDILLQLRSRHLQSAIRRLKKFAEGKRVPFLPQNGLNQAEHFDHLLNESIVLGLRLPWYI